MKILKLRNNPKYFNEFINDVYNEWTELIHVSKCSNIPQLKKLYINILNSNGEVYLYTKDDGELIGFFTLIKIKNKIYLCDVYIKPSYRQRGLGKKMVNYALDSVHEFEPSCKELYVNTYVENTVFYLKIGFKMQKKQDNTYTLVYKLSNNNNTVFYIFGIIAAIILLWWILIR